MENANGDQFEESDELVKIIEDYLAKKESGEPFSEADCLRANPHLEKELTEFFGFDKHFFLGVDNKAQAVSPLDVVSTPHTSANQQVAISTKDLSQSNWSFSHIEEVEFPISFERYDLLGEVARGGMGIVYRAVRRDLGRTVALKVMRSGEFATEEETRRFRTEIDASTKLKHPNIVTTHDAGTIRGLLFIEMELIEGRNLDSHLHHCSENLEQSVRWMLKITEAAAYAHRQNIIHRDIKPSNIIIDESGEPFLADFGLAHRMRENDGATMTGQILGSAQYMPPEQATGRNRNLTPRVDIYSLGAVLYATITGQPPFRGTTHFDILLQVIENEPPTPRQLNRNCPRSLERICTKAMAKEPEKRYATADDMAEDLRRYLRGEVLQFPEPTLSDALATWWRREPILVSHLCALFSVALIVFASFLYGNGGNSPIRFVYKFGLIIIWVSACVALQNLSRIYRRTVIQALWAILDVSIYTALMFIADAPRGLLLVGYPMMIVASGLFYRVRFVVFTTILCNLAMAMLASAVQDPITERIDFLCIYFIGLNVIGLCVQTMIRRIRGLSRFCGASE